MLFPLLPLVCDIICNVRIIFQDKHFTVELDKDSGSLGLNVTVCSPILSFNQH